MNNEVISLFLVMIRVRTVEKDGEYLGVNRITLSGVVKLSESSEDNEQAFQSEFDAMNWEFKDPETAEIEDMSLNIDSASSCCASFTVNIRPFKAGIITVTGTASNGISVSRDIYIDKVYNENKKEYLIGDVNLDGIVDAADSVLVLRATIGLESLTEIQKLVADVNDDGSVDSADAVDIFRYSINQETDSNVGKTIAL